MTYVLGRPEDGAIVVVELATSTETFDRVADAVLGTSLLPGEDPVLLTRAGPRRALSPRRPVASSGIRPLMVQSRQYKIGLVLSSRSANSPTWE